MCCIVIKPKGVKTPSIGPIILSNRDGYGYVTSGGEYYRTIYIQAFARHLRDISQNESAVIHARLATNGSIKRANCHPFFKDGVYFAHNGVLDIKTKKDMTDSQTCFENTILPLIKQNGIDGAKDIINEVCGFSRFAIMIDGSIYLFGEWYYIGGCYYSNVRFMGYSGYILYKPVRFTGYRID